MAEGRILIVEDEIGIADNIAINLECVGYKCAVFLDGDEAAEAIAADHAYDLALLDIMLPGKDGFELLGYMRKYDIPVIYMTAKTDSGSEVRGLKDGAEDYITKPFDMATLLIRMEKVLERCGKLRNVYRAGDIEVDAGNRRIFKNGIEIYLPPLEFDVLVILIKNKNRTVSREFILNEIWGEEFFGEIRTVDVRVANIRKRLGMGEMIRTIPKAGYRLEDKRI